MANKIRVSPTYLSKVERDEFKPPTKDAVRAIAQIIACDSHELLAMAGRMSWDFAGIIKQHLIEISALLRTANGLAAEEITRLAQDAGKTKRK